MLMVTYQLTSIKAKRFHLRWAGPSKDPKNLRILPRQTKGTGLHLTLGGRAESDGSEFLHFFGLVAFRSLKRSRLCARMGRQH
jgi:hypothetical protein